MHGLDQVLGREDLNRMIEFGGGSDGVRTSSRLGPGRSGASGSTPARRLRRQLAATSSRTSAGRSAPAWLRASARMRACACATGSVATSNATQGLRAPLLIG
jgi:hypothetical protein